MRFLLVGVNAKYIHSCPAIYLLKSYCLCKRPEADVEVAEYTINRPYEETVKDIYRHKPDFIGFSCYIWNIEYIEKIIGDIHSILPMCQIWLGGPEASYRASELLEKYVYLSGIMVSEGEETFTELSERLDNDAARYDVKGTTVRNGNEIIINPVREVIDMDSIPFMYKDAADGDNKTLRLFENRIIYYESSRGCPYGCAYCLSSIEKNLRFRNTDTVKKELKFFIDNNVPQVKFVDRTFNCNHERMLELLRFIRDNDNGITNFHFEIAGDILNEEELSLLSSLRKGLVQLEIGVQSFNEETLRAVGRKTNLKVLTDNVRRLRENHNIHLHLDLIAGLPYEDFSSFKQSFNSVYEMQPDDLQLGFLKMLKGTPIDAVKGDYGIICSDNSPYEVLFTKYISYEDIVNLKAVEEMLELYHNSGQFENSEKMLLDRETSPFDLYYNLSVFYKEKGYDTIQSSRIRRYEILLEYYKEKYDDYEAFREYLTIDYYLRENAKGRPSFAAPPDMDKIKSFYENEENIKKYLPEYTGYSTAELRRITHLEVLEHNRESRMALFEYKRPELIYI